MVKPKNICHEINFATMKRCYFININFFYPVKTSYITG